MSHFTVLIVTEDKPTEDVLAKVLEPYNENTTVAPYWELEATEPKGFWWYPQAVEAGKVQAGCTAQELVAAYVAEFGVDDETLRVTAEGHIERETTYNPKSKWDWYQVGGRWHGSLRAKSAGLGGKAGPSWGWSAEEVAGLDPRAVDFGQKKDLDIEGMRDKVAETANERWDKYEAAVAGLEAPKAWQECMATHLVDAEGVTPEEREDRLAAARLEYHDQPFIKALKEAEVFGYFGSWEEEFQGHTRESYVEDKRLSAVCGYAFLSDGETGWLQPGQMGWFGMSSSTPASTRDYHRKVAEIIDALPDEAWLTMVDCHI
jgi:hypothetical protein